MFAVWLDALSSRHHHIMKAPNITLGKWLKNGLVVSGPIGHRIADCNTATGKSDSEKAAIARAIAAVPDLLEALEMLIKDSGRSPDELDSDISSHKPLIAAFAALTKAGYTF